jgi:hypothetical protein
MTLSDGQSVQAVFRLQHAVSTKAEKFGRRSAQSVFILNQKDGLCPAEYLLSF